MLYVLHIVAALHNRIESASKRDDRGATATEYAMLVAFIAIAIALAVTAFGKDLSTFFSGLAHNIGITS